MKFRTSFIICGCFLFVTFHVVASFTKSWSFDLIDITTYTSDPDKIEMNYTIERIARGRFGYSGFVDFKIDLDDSVLVDGTLKRSIDREGPYTAMPFTIDNETLSNAINKFYKQLVMPTVEKCCENAPVFQDKFKAPMTKRKVIMNKCVASTDSMPSVMMDGYYLLRVALIGTDFDTFLEMLVYIENK